MGCDAAERLAALLDHDSGPADQLQHIGKRQQPRTACSEGNAGAHDGRHPLAIADQGDQAEKDDADEMPEHYGPESCPDAGGGQQTTGEYFGH